MYYSETISLNYTTEYNYYYNLVGYCRGQNNIFSYAGREKSNCPMPISMTCIHEHETALYFYLNINGNLQR